MKNIKKKFDFIWIEEIHLVIKISLKFNIIFLNKLVCIVK